MALLSEKDREDLRKMLSERLENEVEILFYGSPQFKHSEEAREILKEVESLTDKVKVTEADGSFERYPVITFKGHENIIFEGLPAGYEFVSLIEAIILVSTGKTGLPADIEEGVRKVGKAEIKVFITPTCPYCPRAVITAHKFAYLNPNIKGIMVEALEFPEYAQKYSVMAVPKVVINDKVEFEGAVPEKFFLEKVVEADGAD